MSTPLSAIPDGSLGEILARMGPTVSRTGLLPHLAAALGGYAGKGGRIRELNHQASLFEDGRWMPVPAPPTDASRPGRADRRDVLADLAHLREIGRELRLTRREERRFALRLLRAAGLSADLSRSWLRVLDRKQTHLDRERIRFRYHHLHRQSRPDRSRTLNGRWDPDPARDLEALHREIKACFDGPDPLLNRSRRARVVRTRLQDRDVILKHFRPNPRFWRRRWEISRARRSWIGGHTLAATGLACGTPLGWLEVREHGLLLDAYFISVPPPARENARSWLRRILPDLDEHGRDRLRHRLRDELLKLHHAGLHHRDLKLGNLLVAAETPDRPRFYWIDLEDLRPGRSSPRTQLRNFYQLNGSLPRNVSRAERLAFARGFHQVNPLAAHPWSLAFVEWMTRRRLRRELNRVCGA